MSPNSFLEPSSQDPPLFAGLKNVFIVVTFYDKHWFFFLKVQNHSFKCQYNLKEGVSVTSQCLEEVWGLGELFKIFYFFRYYDTSMLGLPARK